MDLDTRVARLLPSLTQYRLACNIALSCHCRGHVAPGLDLIHQHSSGEASQWSHMQVSSVTKSHVLCWYEEARGKEKSRKMMCLCWFFSVVVFLV